MIALFHTRDGASSLAMIAKAREDETRREIILTMTDGTTVRTAGELPDFMERAVQIIPAEAGWNVIHAWHDSGGMRTLRYPLIAWALCIDGQIRAVTPTGVSDGLAGGWDTPPIYVETNRGQILAVGLDVDPPTYDTVEELAAGTDKRDERRRREREEEDRRRDEARDAALGAAGR